MTTYHSKWIPVSRKYPCPICHKPDWCAQGERFINCMRIANNNPCKNGGWLYPLNSEHPKPRPVRQWIPSTATPNLDAMLDQWRRQSNEAHLCWLASSLGVKCDALKSIGTCQRDEHVWAFPMRDGDGKTIGIRLRHDSGNKWAIKGSRQGLFITNQPSGDTAFICEGPTDTAAALTIGLWAVGRASCAGPNQELRRLLKARNIRRAVILSDNDDPGINGSERLSHEIGVACVVLVLPAKDMREFVRCGGNREMIEWMMRETIWTNS